MSSNHVTATKRSRSVNFTAAGITNVNGAVIDMAGFEGVVFVGSFGALTATQVTGMKVQVGNVANLSDAVDLAGAAVGPLLDGDSNKLLVLEVHKFPVGFRYTRVVVTRATANAVIDGVTATQYGTRDKPETEDTTVAFATVVIEPYPVNAALTVTTITPVGTTTKIVITARNSS